MAIRFRGEFFQKTDAKCRLSVPAEFRRALGQHGDQRLVLAQTANSECITIYPATVWEAYEDRILALPQYKKAIRNLLRLQIASASEGTPDGHGRVVLAPNLRAAAAIEAGADVVVVGQIDHFELWQRDRWDAARLAAAAGLDTLDDDLAELGL